MYDNDFRITSRSVNGANQINFEYDTDSLIDKAKALNDTVILDLDYDTDPVLEKNSLLRHTEIWADTTNTDGVFDDYGYNSFGEVNSYIAKFTNDGGTTTSTKFDVTYERDKLGRITKKTESVDGGPIKKLQYDYNQAGYLIKVTDITYLVSPVILNTYTYDLNGNRENNGSVYDDQDRLTSTSTATYTYTNNGELLAKTENGQVTSYTYDVLGNLKKVVLPSGTMIDYLIDGHNRQIGKKVDGLFQQGWLYKDALNPIAELDSNGNIVSRFVYASRTNIPDLMIKAEITYRIISDHLGSPRLVVNTSDGTVVQAIEYDEWGNVLSDTNPGFMPFAFAGGLHDRDTKLVRFGARDYDPEIGRWTSKDPIRFGGGDPNLYGYVLNDPLNFIDYEGLLSYLVSRPLSFPEFGLIGGHMFIVTNAKYIGDPNATVYSYGMLGNGNAGNVAGAQNAESIATFINDQKFWKNLQKLNCNAIDPFKQFPITKIKARDDVVSEFANRVIENRRYSIFGFNSNAIARGVAERASGGPVALPPDGKWTPGTALSHEVEFVGD